MTPRITQMSVTRALVIVAASCKNMGGTFVFRGDRHLREYAPTHFTPNMVAAWSGRPNNNLCFKHVRACACHVEHEAAVFHFMNNKH